VVSFEVEPGPEYVPVGTEEIVGRVRDAIGPLVGGTMVVLDKARAVSPEAVEVKFGIKASGTMSRCVAKVATEATFEVTLKWSGQAPDGGAVPQSVTSN
jgi:hypothetical protein